MYIDIRTASKALKAIMVGHRESKGTLKDYDKLIVCSLMGNFKPMFTTKLYIKHSPEYCEALCYVDEIASKISSISFISQYMDTDMLKEYFAVGSKVPAYGGTTDTVIEFRDNVAVWGWCVYVKDEKGKIRSHSTCPSHVRDLLKRKELNK